MYADYTFYTTTYYGTIISSTDFPRLEDIASDKLYHLTMGRIDMYLVEDSSGNMVLDDSKVSTNIKKAVCKIAELIYDIEKAEEVYRKSLETATSTGVSATGKVASITAGSESITYFNSSSGESTVASMATADYKTQDQYFFESIRMYLGWTGLLSQVL